MEGRWEGAGKTSQESHRIPRERERGREQRGGRGWKIFFSLRWGGSISNQKGGERGGKKKRE